MLGRVVWVGVTLVAVVFGLFIPDVGRLGTDGGGGMKREPLRAVAYLAIGLLSTGIAIWSGQDIGGAWIIGSYGAVGLFHAGGARGSTVGRLMVGFARPSRLGRRPGISADVIDGHADAGVTFLAWVKSWGGSLWFGTLVALTVLFPAGRFPSGRVGVVGRVAVADPVLPAIPSPSRRPPHLRPSGWRSRAPPLAIAPDWPVWPVSQTGV